MDVKYVPTDWEKMKSGIGNLIGLGVYGKGMIDDLKDISSNLEDAESAVAKYDTDGVVSFTHTDKKNTYQNLFEDFKVLHRFTGKVGDIVDRTIDQPFYEDIDAFVAEVQQLSISNYKTKNRIGVTKMVHLPGSYESMEVPKTEVGLDDLFSGDSFYAEQMKLEYESWKQLNADQDITQEDYQIAVLNTNAFGYESIQNQQENKEFWVNIAALVVIVGVAIVCPPAGLALGAVYGSLELKSAISGEDWVSGRELGTTERWLRGALSPLDLVPGVVGVKRFSGAVRTVNLGGDLGQLGLKSGVKASLQTGLKHVDDLVVTAGKQATTRLKSAGAAIKDTSKEVQIQLLKRGVEAGKLADTTITAAKNIVPSRQMGLATDQIGTVHIPAENTHFLENAMKDRLSKIEGLNVGGNNARSIQGRFGFDSTSELKGFNQQISMDLEKHNISLEVFHDLRLKPVSALTNVEINVMKQIRDAVPPITSDTLLQKTIPIQDVEKYLSGEFREIGGYVAKVEDIKDIKKYDDVVESSRLDYTIWDGTRPYPEGGNSYAMIRFKTSKIDEIDIPYGEKFGGANTDGPPCTLNGFTGARNGEIIPEWEFNGRYLPKNGAELYEVINGEEVLRAVFEGGKFVGIN